MYIVNYPIKLRYSTCDIYIYIMCVMCVNSILLILNWITHLLLLHTLLHGTQMQIMHYSLGPTILSIPLFLPLSLPLSLPLTLPIYLPHYIFIYQPLSLPPLSTPLSTPLPLSISLSLPHSIFISSFLSISLSTPFNPYH